MKKIKLTLMLLFFSLNAFALTPLQQEIVNSVNSNQAEMLKLLEQTVNINSGSRNIKGVKQVGAAYIKPLQALGFHTRWISMPQSMHRAGHLFAYRKGASNGLRLLLIGHLDTVFEKNHSFQHYLRKDNIATGPGVSDMKGGNAVLLYALKALNDHKLLKNSNIIVALIGDEESAGMPHSLARKTLIEAGKQSDIALGFESAHDLQHAVTGRRGLATWRLSVKAISGHSSLIFTPQFSQGAIIAISQVLNQMFSYIKDYQYLSFNPAFIAGGSKLKVKKSDAKAGGKTNIIADKAYSKGEVRFVDFANVDKFKAQVVAYLKQLPANIKVNFSINDKDYMPSMKPTKNNRALLKVLSNINQELNLGTLSEHNPRFRGGADISYVADYVTGIDGLGAIGGNEHASHEFIYIDKTLLATQRAALLINQLISQKLK